MYLSNSIACCSTLHEHWFVMQAVCLSVCLSVRPYICPSFQFKSMQNVLTSIGMEFSVDTIMLFGTLRLSFKGQWLLYVPPSTFRNPTFCPHKVFVLCGSQNKQLLFSYTTLTDWFCDISCFRRGVNGF
jgi:hypothetical protein